MMLLLVFIKRGGYFLMTSETEGLPTVLVESLSNGCNVIFLLIVSLGLVKY